MIMTICIAINCVVLCGSAIVWGPSLALRGMAEEDFFRAVCHQVALTITDSRIDTAHPPSFTFLPPLALLRARSKACPKFA